MLTAGPQPTNQPDTPDEQDALVEAEAKPPWRKILSLALLAVGLLVIVYLSPLRHHLGKVRELSEYIRSFGWMAPVVLTSTVALLVAVGFPRLVFCVISGMALGFWQGLLWAQLGTLIGSYALFIFARASGGDWIRRHLGRHKRLAGILHEEGLTGVVLAKQLPIPGFFVNLAFGLVTVRHRDFLIGTVIGQLPQAIPCTLIGAGVLKASFAKSFGFIALAVAVAVLAWVALKRVLRSKHHPHHAPPSSPQTAAGA